MRYFLFTFWIVPFLGFSQKGPSIDFIKIDAEVLPIPESKEIKGTASYTFELNAAADSIFLDAVNMTFSRIDLNGKEIAFSNTGRRLGIKAPKKPGKHQLLIRYSTQPRQTVYFMGRVTEVPRSDQKEGVASGQFGHHSSFQIWTQGQGKYTSHWLPSVDDMTDKIEFDLTILAEDAYEVIANGKLVGKTPKGGMIMWQFDMINPMSSYLVAFVIGNFDKKTITSKSGIPIELYYEPKDSLNFEPTYRYTKEIFDFLEEEIGVGYPWQNYKQVPVHDFLYAGMENTTSTIFSNQYVVDSIAFVDKNYVNVNAHELAHQWFGNLVTEENGEHHWLHEGFATYYAYLAEKELFGEDHFYWKLYQTARTLHNLSENEGGEALNDPNANSLTFYEKGAWALVALRQLVGDLAFRTGIQNYVKTYAFKNATISNFLTEMEKASAMNLKSFRERWLESEEYPWGEVKALLASNNSSLQRFFELQDRKTDTSLLPKEELLNLWGKDAPMPFKRELVFKFGTQIPDAALSKMMSGESLEVKQAIAQTIPEIPKELQASFESLLEDKSYLTQEIVLFKLWQAFPDRQRDYLDRLDGTVGLPNKNVRLLWLTLALITPEYQTENKKAFYHELNCYTETHYNFEIRKLAFQYLHQIRALSDQSLKNLIQAADHHVWQFQKTSRNLLREINASDQGKERLLQLSLKEEEQGLLNKILNP